MKTRKLVLSVLLAGVALLSLTMGAFAQTPTTTLDAATAQAMTDAINDEYHAYAFYNAVIAKFGQVAPFTNIARSEATHIESLKTLFVRYGLPVPADPYAGKIKVPATFQAALQAGIDAEIANIALYDKFNPVTQPDIKLVFDQLRDASQTKHLPAFQRALGNNSTGTSASTQFFGRRWAR
jgi:hypothetical protein